MKTIFPRFWSFAAPALAVLGMPLFVGNMAAQSANSSQAESQPGVTVRELHPKPQTRLFPLHDRTQARTTLEFRTPEQMTAADRELVEANEAEIARRAQLQGFHLSGETAGGGQWGYEQAVCPVFPQHVILDYSRDNGHGDVTLFSVVIPRSEGHVRVIPVRRRGYSLFTPASSNALTLNDFNHMVTEGHAGLNPDWLTLGLCYAALAGGHVRAALVAHSPAEETYPLFPPAKLELNGNGTAEIVFTDVTANTRAMEWKLTFAANGQLKKVHHGDTYAIQGKPVAGREIDLAAVPAGTASQP